MCLDTGWSGLDPVLQLFAACLFGWFVSLLVRKEVLLAGLCEKKILFQLEIYDHLRQVTANRTCCIFSVETEELRT